MKQYIFITYFVIFFSLNIYAFDSHTESSSGILKLLCEDGDTPTGSPSLLSFNVTFHGALHDTNCSVSEKESAYWRVGKVNISISGLPLTLSALGLARSTGENWSSFPTNISSLTSGISFQVPIYFGTAASPAAADWEVTASMTGLGTLVSVNVSQAKICYIQDADSNCTITTKTITIS